MNLLIMRSDISDELKAMRASLALDAHPAIIDWTLDMEDVDHVLRVRVHPPITEKDIDNLIKPYGLHCEDLAK